MADNPRAIVTSTETITGSREMLPDQHGVMRPYFVIVSTTGFRAELPECGCERAPCGNYAHRNYAHRDAKRQDEHQRTHCHSWHAPMANAFAQKVAGTYGRKKR